MAYSIAIWQNTPDTWSQEVKSSTVLSLIKANGVFKKTNALNEFEDITLNEPLTKSDFESHGIDGLNNIPKSEWDTLTNFEIHTWTDDDNKPEASVTVPMYNLFNELKDEKPKLLIYNSDTKQTPELNYTFVPKAGYYRYRVHIDDVLTPENPDLILSDWSQMISKDTEATVIVPSETFTHLNPYPITVEVEQYDDKIVKNTGQVLIYNEAPTLYGKIEGNKLDMVVGDPDADKVRISIRVNGKRVYPEYGEDDFAPYQDTPYDLTYVFDSKDYIIGSLNSVEIVAKDEFNVEGRINLSFMGDYFGMIFCKDDGTPFSTDEGVILERLDFGLVQAGKYSDVKQAYLDNRNSYKVNNPKVWINPDTVPDGSEIKISKTLEPFIAEEVLQWNDAMETNERVDFYIQIKTDILATNGGSFEILTKAEPVHADV